MRQMTGDFSGRERILELKDELARWLAAKFRPEAECEPNRIKLSVNVLRWSLGFLYLWFGALKFFPGLSSAESLAGATMEIMTFGVATPAFSLPLLAIWETAIGLALLTGKFQKAALLSLYFHVAGTFAPLLLLPEQTWSRPLIAASLEGQYIFKNLVTVGAVLVINASEGCRK